MDILSLLIFAPLLSGIILLILPVKTVIAKHISLTIAVFTFLLGFELFFAFESIAGLQFTRITPWITSYGIIYNIGIDGLSLPILMAIVILMPPIYILLWHQPNKGYWANMMILQGSVTGALFSQDLILFYLFWEMMLLPIFFMIGMYGTGDRRHTAIKVTLYTMFGSFLMLVSILYLGFNHYEQIGHWTFSLHDIQNVTLQSEELLLVFVGFLMAFAIKIPFFPFHTWLPVTYSDAPTGTVVILSSIMAKLGVYALLRFIFPIFPEFIVQYSQMFVIGGIIGLLYFGIAALMQNDIKRMLAYSSGSHLSMIVIGIFSLNIIGLHGAMYLIVAHALATGALFLMVEYLERSTGTKEIDQLGGLAKTAPVFTILFAFFMLTIIGLPGTSGFVSELLIIFGIFKESIFAGVITASSVLIGVSFMLWMFGRVLLGKATHSNITMPDISTKYIVALLPIAVLIVAMGVYPHPFMEIIEPSLLNTLDILKGAE